MLQSGLRRIQLTCLKHLFWSSEQWLVIYCICTQLAYYQLGHIHMRVSTGVQSLLSSSLQAAEHACRDLKLDNTLLDNSDPPMLKLCDFGFAKTWTEDANMFTHIG